MLIATAIPGCTYSASTFTIPWSALNSSTTVDTTAADSFERLLHNLLTILFEKQNAATITQVNCGVEISSTSLSLNSWETATNVFSDRTVQSFLVSFDTGSSVTPLLVDGDSVTNV